MKSCCTTNDIAFCRRFLLLSTYDQEIIIVAQDVAKRVVKSSASHFKDALRVGHLLEVSCLHALQQKSSLGHVVVRVQVEGSKYGNFTNFVVSSEFRSFWTSSRESAKVFFAVALRESEAVY